MKIVEMTGGLGNQMFQYEFGRSLQIKYPDEMIKYDLSYYSAQSAIRKLELDSVFDLDIFAASKSEIRNVRGCYQYDNSIRRCFAKVFNDSTRCGKEIVEDLDQEFDEGTIIHDGDTYFSGYWQCEKYFSARRDEVLADFSFDRAKRELNESDLCDKVERENSVAIHVRLEDYLQKNNFRLYGDICTKDYYKIAIEYLKERIPECSFFVFSTDVKEAISFLPENNDYYPVDYDGQSNLY